MNDPAVNLMTEVILQLFQPYRKLLLSKIKADFRRDTGKIWNRNKIDFREYAKRAVNKQQTDFALERQDRIRFANSKLVQVYSDCVGSVSYSKLKQKIVDYADTYRKDALHGGFDMIDSDKMNMKGAGVDNEDNFIDPFLAAQRKLDLIKKAKTIIRERNIKKINNFLKKDL